MMMALAATQNLPTVLVPGGVTLPPTEGEDAGKVQTIGARSAHAELTLQEAADLGCRACGSPGGGWQFLGTAATSLANPQHREAFRAACTGMLAAYPSSPDPVASWGSAYWNNLIRTLELGKGYPLLHTA